MPSPVDPKLPTDLPDLEWGELELLRLLRRLPVDALDDFCAQTSRWLRGEATIPDEELRPLESEPHALGWLHQHQGERRRATSFSAHHTAETKHLDSTSTTQLFTPRWVAHVLAETCFAISGPADLLDPACGSGQMLLAWVDVLIRNGTPARQALESVRGVDLDPAAVLSCKQVMKLHARRVLGDGADLDSVFDTNIRCADGLFSEIRPASVVVTNPPYMGARSMSKPTREALRIFAPFDADLSAAFIRRCFDLATVCTGVLAQQSFWFVKQFTKARNVLLKEAHLDTFIHLGPGVFRSLNGEKAAVVGFVLDRQAGPTKFHDLRAGKADQKRLNYLEVKIQEFETSRFQTIPGNPIAHWLSDPLIKQFSAMPKLGDYFEIPTQNKTGNNRKYVQKLNQTPDEKLISSELFFSEGLASLVEWSGCKERWISGELPCAGSWALYSKGGPVAPWWGNWEHVIDLSLDARAFYRTNRTSNLAGYHSVFRKGVTYTDFGGLQFSARAFPAGAVADMSGPAIFSIHDDPIQLNAAMAVLNSSAPRALLNAMNPTLHYQVGDVRNLPFPEPGQWCEDISPLVERLIRLVQSLLASNNGSPEHRFGITPSNDFETVQQLQHQIEKQIAALYGVAPGSTTTHAGLKALQGKP